VENTHHMLSMLFAKTVIKISPCLLKLQLAKVGTFLRHGIEQKISKQFMYFVSSVMFWVFGLACKLKFMLHAVLFFPFPLS